MLQQEAYPAIWRPVDAQNSAKIGEYLSEIRPNRRANFTPIGKGPAEKSVTVQTEGKKKQ